MVLRCSAIPLRPRSTRGLLRLGHDLRRLGDDPARRAGTTCGTACGSRPRRGGPPSPASSGTRRWSHATDLVSRAPGEHVFALESAAAIWGLPAIEAWPTHVSRLASGPRTRGSRLFRVHVGAPAELSPPTVSCVTTAARTVVDLARTGLARQGPGRCRPRAPPRPVHRQPSSWRPRTPCPPGSRDVREPLSSPQLADAAIDVTGREPVPRRDVPAQPAPARPPGRGGGCRRPRRHRRLRVAGSRSASSTDVASTAWGRAPTRPRPPRCCGARSGGRTGFADWSGWPGGPGRMPFDERRLAGILDEQGIRPSAAQHLDRPRGADRHP